MGKKKQKSEQNSAPSGKSASSQLGAKKSYKFSADGGACADPHEDNTLHKVQISTGQEKIILDLILKNQEEQGQRMKGSASTRMTTKKLTDMYTSLATAGFRHNQIEQAMTSVVHYGGDLSSALDWLCLNTPNNQLPEGFSQTFSGEEKKKREGYKPEQAGREGVREKTKDVPDAKQQPKSATKEKLSNENSVKNWILQYSEQYEDESGSGSDSNDLDTGSNLDPNDRYLELTAKLLDARSQASSAKLSGDKTTQKEASARIRQLTIEMNQLEQLPSFNPDIKIRGIDCEKAVVTMTTAEQAGNEKNQDEPEELGFAALEEQATADVKKVSENKVKSVPVDKRSFEYTRQQWTGKSPKQFLIDWVRKHMPKSPPPSFSKQSAPSGSWRSRVRIQRKDGDIMECPDIVTENVKEAEHLAATLALYRLCKGQRVYQLLPPPYRDVWLEWQDAEDRGSAEAKAEKNKPRDQLVTKLMKKLTVDDSTRPRREETEDNEEVTWEDMLTEDEDLSDSALTVKKAQSSSKISSHSLAKLKGVLERNRQSADYSRVLAQRRMLPVFNHKEAVVSLLATHNVVVVAGETGSGKSTQIPQFILETCVESQEPCEIICTQPRRISAISLASRVSQELGEPAGAGGHDSLTGYSIRLETKRSPLTRLTYCTTGVLLRRMQTDSDLSHVTHVIIDEVHERSVQSDFLLLTIRRLLSRKPSLKVILMSATLDSAKFSSYFNHCPVLEIPGRTFPVQDFHLEDVVEVTGYSLEDGSRYTRNTNSLIQEVHENITVSGQRGKSHDLQVSWSKDDLYTIDQTGLDPSLYSLKTRNTVTRMHQSRVNLDLIVSLLGHLDTDPLYREMSGSVLVFLPGLSDIQELYELLNADPCFSHERFRIIALHSVLSSRDQTSAFDVPPSGVRKIVLATNIAETGITIPDVVFVIDSGKVKENKYVESCQMSQLQEVFISRASAKQRQGRAGRVREGYCFKLYTKKRYQGLAAYTVPEILRVPLEELCLHIMKCNLGHPVDFFSEAIDAPNPLTVSRAMSVLREVGACQESSAMLTPLGHHLAALPVHVRLGKMLVYAAVLGCLQPMSVITAAMSDKSPFVAPLDKRHLADEAKRKMAMFDSDHLTVYKAYLGWKTARQKGRSSENAYCERHFLRRATLIDIENTANDLYQLVCSAGFEVLNIQQLIKPKKKMLSKPTSDIINISETPSAALDSSISTTMATILKAVLTAGLYPHLAQVFYTPPVDYAVNKEEHHCVGQTAQGVAYIHPTSVNHKLAANGWTVYQEKVKTAKVYLRDTTLISPYPVLLFGGSLAVQHKEQIIAIDDWVKFKANARTAVIFKELRILLDSLLEKKLENPRLDLAGEETVSVLLDLLLSERVKH